MKLQVLKVKMPFSIFDAAIYLWWAFFALCKVFLLAAASTLLITVGTNRYLGAEYTLDTVGYVFDSLFVLFAVLEIFNNRFIYLKRDDTQQKENQQ